jgi:Met-zincin/Domain of unknown function (DUF5117)/Domain of unknown function (DUF5118)
MLRCASKLVASLALALPLSAAAMDLRELAGCKPGAEDPVVSREGLFTAHMVCDRLLLEVPAALYGRDMLISTEFAAISGGADFIAPGTLVSNRVVRLTERGNKVNVEGLKFDIASDREAGIERAVEATTLPTLLRTFDVLARGPKGEALIDLTPMFVTEPPRGFAFGFMKYFGTSEIDPRRSYIEAVKTFPRNIGIRYYQTWVADTGDLMKRVETGEESVTAAMGFVFYTNFYLLPDKPMRPRFWDPRVGYFATPFRDYGSGEYGGVPRGFIQRYRLEKKDPKAAVSDPVEPILFYIGREVPEVWRPYLKQAVEDWAVVFEKAGFRNAIVARNAPSEDEDPTWDPEDVSHNVIRWAPSGRRNALGAAVVDPRSGEVISSHAIFWHDVLRLLETWYFTQASPLDPRAQQLPLQPELMGELLRYVVRHEIGHALGLRHNFKATAAVGARELRDREWTATWGTSASTMSYARFNYVAQPGDGAALIPTFGPYDYFAIDWGYRVFSETMTPDEEHAKLDAMASLQVDDPLLRFGGEDTLAELDPSVFSNVVGGDAIEAADLGLRNIDRIMAFIIPATTRTGESYDKLREMYEAVVQQRHRELVYVSKLIGGVEETRYQAGRGKAPFVPVAPERQREAAKFLVQRALIEPKVLLDREVLNRIAPSGGTNPLQGSNVDLMRRVIDPGVFQRMMEASSVGAGRYTGLELLSDLNDGLFRELAAKSPAVTAYRRQVQRSYVTILLTATNTIEDPSARGSSIASADIAGSDAAYVDSGARRDAETLSRRHRSFDSAIAKVGEQYSASTGALSEYRAVLRAAVADLYKKIDEAIARTRDADTLLHLRLLRGQLANVS